MNSRGKIIAGLIVLLAAATSPIWYTLAAGGSPPRPEVELPAGQSQCVEDREYMTSHHMELLDEWRYAVVREGEGTYRSRAFGKEYEMSLTRTCMDCHTDRESFCDRCHNYVDVQPYCWDCHVEPERN